MSIINPQNRAFVPAEDRKAMTPARKARIHAMRDGKCWMCNFPVPVSGPEVVYDHRTPLELGGTDDNSNIYPLHASPCNKLKTKADANRIAKLRRQSKMGSPKAPSTMKSRPFPKDLRRKMNGQVESKP